MEFIQEAGGMGEVTRVNCCEVFDRVGGGGTVEKTSLDPWVINKSSDQTGTIVIGKFDHFPPRGNKFNLKRI